MTFQAPNPKDLQVKYTIIKGFGYGKIIDLGRHQSLDVPCSNTYKIDTFVDNNQAKKHGYSLGLSR